MNIVKFLQHLSCGFSEAEYDEIESGEIILKSGHKIVWNQKDVQSRAWEVDQNTCDHDWEWVNDDNGAEYPYEVSYSHWECEICGLTREPGPHDFYDPDF